MAWRSQPPVALAQQQRPCGSVSQLPLGLHASDAGRRLRQPPLSTRDRQRMHMLFNRVEHERRQVGAGAIHSVKYHFAGNSTSVEVIYDDGRGGRGAGTDRASAPTNSRATHPSGSVPQQHTSSQERRAARGRTAQQRRGGNGSLTQSATAHQPQQMDQDRVNSIIDSEEDPFFDWFARLTKSQAKQIESSTKVIITKIVRSLGGSVQDGGQFLLPVRALRFGDHKVTLRLPIGSDAAEMQDSDLEFFLTESYYKYSGDPEKGGQIVHAALKPKARDIDA